MHSGCISTHHSVLAISVDTGDVEQMHRNLSYQSFKTACIFVNMVTIIESLVIVIHKDHYYSCEFILELTVVDIIDIIVKYFWVVK